MQLAFPYAQACPAAGGGKLTVYQFLSLR
jgi:hypothetical protein